MARNPFINLLNYTITITGRIGLKMALYAHVSGLVENITYLYARAQSRARLSPALNPDSAC